MKVVGFELTSKTAKNWMKEYCSRRSTEKKSKEIENCKVSPKRRGGLCLFVFVSVFFLWLHPGYRRDALMDQAEDRLLRSLNCLC